MKNPKRPQHQRTLNSKLTIRGYRNVFRRISKRILTTLNAVKINRVNNLGTSLVIAITLLGSVGSAAAIFAPEVRSFLRLDNSQGVPNIVSSGWKIYEDKSVFSVSYPSNWTIQDTLNLTDGTHVKIMPLNNAKVIDSVYVSIVIQEANSASTLEEYQVKAEGFIETYLDNGTKTGQSRSILGGRPALILEYEGAVDNLPTKFIQKAAFNKDKLLLVTYSAPETAFDKFETTALEIINSFKIKD